MCFTFKESLPSSEKEATYQLWEHGHAVEEWGWIPV